jgi:hypothetical protein
MSAPHYLSSYYRHKESLAVTDVNTIIADLRDELVTQPIAPNKWTEPVALTFQSPARADGIFLTITVARVSATRISYIVKDQSGMPVNNMTTTQQDIDAGGTTVHYFTGPFHVCVTTERATPEAWMCGVLDQTPDALGNPRAMYFASTGPRSNTGTLVAGAYFNVYLLTPGATSYATTSSMITCSGGQSSSWYRETVAGTKIYQPFEVNDGNGSAVAMFLGRVFQCLMVDGRIAFATDLTIPIDGANTGVFKVAGFATDLNSGSARLAFRKA